MSRKNIPARVEITCDFCKSNGGEHRRDGRVKILSSSFDHWGNGCNSPVELDLCDKCLFEFEELVFKLRGLSKC